MIRERIEKEIVIAAPVERVWEVVTRPEHVGVWFGDAGAEIDLRPGGAITFSWKQYGTHRAVVEKVDAPHYFAYRWEAPGEASIEDGNATLVEFSLRAHETGTLLKVTESGFGALPLPPAEQASYAEQNVEGWNAELAELVTYAERLAGT
jgi:uncharacterized protein YndB with AHSA1/START domain